MLWRDKEERDLLCGKDKFFENRIYPALNFVIEINKKYFEDFRQSLVLGKQPFRQKVHDVS